MYTTLLFDWGNTLMIDFPDEKGPMYTWTRVKTVAQASKVLRVLRRKYRCCIATNAKDSTKEDIIKALKRGRINTYIAAIYCYKEIGHEKSTAAYFQAIIGNGNKKEYLMIGDDLQSDIEGAKQFGIDAVLFDPQNKYPGYEGEKIQKLSTLIYILYTH